MSGQKTERFQVGAPPTALLPGGGGGGLLAAYTPLIFIGAQMNTGQRPTTAPHVLYKKLAEELKAARHRAGGQAELAEFAVLALLDQAALRCGGEYAATWAREPLEFHFRSTNTAGEKFFDRLSTTVLPGGNVDMQEIFLLCLDAGFTGKLEGNPNQLQNFRDQLRRSQQANRSLPRLAPDLPPPPPPRALDRPTELWKFAALVGLVLLTVAGVAAVGVTVQALSLRSEIETNTRQLQRQTGEPEVQEK